MKAEDRPHGIVISVASEPRFWRVWPFSLVCRPVGVRWHQPVSYSVWKAMVFYFYHRVWSAANRAMGNLPEYDPGKALGTEGVSLRQYSSYSSRHSLN